MAENPSRIDTETPRTIFSGRNSFGSRINHVSGEVLPEGVSVEYVPARALARVEAERERLAWAIRELHEGACSPAYRPPNSDYRVWALDVIESNVPEALSEPTNSSHDRGQVDPVKLPAGSPSSSQSLGLRQQPDAVANDATIGSSDAQDTDTGVRGADAARVDPHREELADELASLNAQFEQRYRTLVDLHDRHVDLRAAVSDIHSWLADVETSSLTVEQVKDKIRVMAGDALAKDGDPDVV